MSSSLGIELPPHDEPRSEGYDEFFHPPLESKYECFICLLGLREPVQTSCGHRFCKGCILRSIRDAGPRCPVDNERLDETQLFPDNFAKREVLSHDVFCQFKEEHDCPWKGPLHELEDHQKECEFVDVNCIKNCGKRMKKKDLLEHLEKECPNRTVPCDYCKEEMRWNGLESHYEACPKYPLPCGTCGKENIPRDMMQEHLEDECPCNFMAGHFKIASDEDLNKRKIIKAKRRVNPSDKQVGGIHGFPGFAGLNNNSKGFGASSFPMKPLPGMSSLSSGPSNMFSSVKPPSTETSTRLSQEKDTHQNGFKATSSGNSQAHKPSSSSYQDNIKALNESVAAWIQKHISLNPYVDLTPIFNDYKEHMKNIDLKFSR